MRKGYWEGRVIQRRGRFFGQYRYRPAGILDWLQTIVTEKPFYWYSDAYVPFESAEELRHYVCEELEKRNASDRVIYRLLPW